MKKKKRVRIIVIIVVVALLILGPLNIRSHTLLSYKADEKTIAAMEAETESVRDEKTDDYEVFVPENTDDIKAGIIFYPGGWVDFRAYEGLMYEIADRGYVCVLLRAPENLAFLKVGEADEAKEIRDRYPAAKDWYLAGHSLGGAAAGLYLPKKEDDYSGIILLASYITKDLSDSDLSLLSIYGDRDGVLNMEKYRENRKNWPAHSREEVIRGGIHSYFGAYGLQKGDGEPDITCLEQTEETADLIDAFISDDQTGYTEAGPAAFQQIQGVQKP